MGTNAPLAQSTQLILTLVNEGSTQQLARALALVMPQGVVHLRGEVGAGKTTLVRYWLQRRGITGTIKSPTYTIVEPYIDADDVVYHFDFYRVEQPDELELLGIRDYVSDTRALVLIEWPERGHDLTPPADVQITLSLLPVDQRRVTLQAISEQGQAVIGQLKARFVGDHDVVPHSR